MSAIVFVVVAGNDIVRVHIFVVVIVIVVVARNDIVSVIVVDFVDVVVENYIVSAIVVDVVGGGTVADKTAFFCFGCCS